MNENTPIESPEELARRDALSRQRFWIISLFRLSGALIILFGMAISLQRFGWVQGDKAKWMGIIVSTMGFVQFIIVPRMLIRAFATPREMSGKETTGDRS
jgi:NhaP-type Na+/H+ or K+/H+ antiporter